MGPGRAPRAGRFVERRRRQSLGRLSTARLWQRHGGLGADSGVHDRHGRPQGHTRALAGRWRRAAVPDPRHAGPAGAQRLRRRIRLCRAGSRRHRSGRLHRASWHPRPRWARIGVGDPFLWRDCDPGIAETAHEAVNALARAGAVTREFTLPEADAAYTLFLQGSLSAIELRSFLDRELPDWLAQLDPVIAPALRDESLSARDYLARIARLRALARSAGPRL